MNAFNDQELHQLVQDAGLRVEKFEKIDGYSDSESGKTVYYWAMLLTLQVSNAVC